MDKRLFSLDVYRQKRIKRFEINYVNEILFDEEISIFVNEIEKDDFRFEIRKEGKPPAEQEWY